MSRPRLLDLFSGAGGSAVGYHRAGFDIVGVDNRPQPNYPFQVIQADALEVLDNLLACREGRYPIEWDAIHASPPCQAYIRGGLQNHDRHADLLGETRQALEATELPWVIENVPGAPMRPDIVLCGSMFGLPIRRHRWFETSWGETMMTLSCDHSQPVVGVYGHPHGEQGAWKGMKPWSLESWSEAMGIDWMTSAELSQAIPPMYCELIGAQLIDQIRRQAA